MSDVRLYGQTPHTITLCDTCHASRDCCHSLITSLITDPMITWVTDCCRLLTGTNLTPEWGKGRLRSHIKGSNVTQCGKMAHQIFPLLNATAQLLKSEILIVMRINHVITTAAPNVKVAFLQNEFLMDLDLILQHQLGTTRLLLMIGIKFRIDLYSQFS